jgi:hypothetical protein
VTGRGAVRRSLVVWGWGHVATGDRRGFLLAVTEVACLAAFAWFAPPLLDGSLVIAIFGAGAAFLAAWGAIAILAYRRAVKGRLADGSDDRDGGAAELLWLAPVAIVGMTVLWAIGGSLARSDATLARYVHDWQTGNAEGAVSLFVTPPPPADLEVIWERQLATLRNELVSLEAEGAGGGVQPDEPFASMRFVEPTDGAGTGDTRRVDVEIVRRETIRGSFLGLFPTTSQVLVPVADLGWFDFRRVSEPSSRAGVPDSPVWLIDRFDLLGERYPPSPAGSIRPDPRQSPWERGVRPLPAAHRPE